MVVNPRPPLPSLATDLLARLREFRMRRRWLRTWRGTLWPRRAGLAAGLALAAAAVALALASLSLLGVGRDLGRTLVLNTATAIAVGALAYMWFVTRTRRRALSRVLQVARLTPEELFFPAAGERRPPPIGRDRLVAALANDLQRRFRPSPEILVGETGAGKTTVLLALAHYMAERGVVPIPISLRGVKQDKLDFHQLAHDRFLDLVDPYVESESDAERVWRALCIDHSLVVLADDLDRSAADDEDDHRRTATRHALERAYDRELPLVVTSRRDGVPPALERWAIELDELEVNDRQAEAHVVARSGWHADQVQVDVGAIVREGALRENPFYLQTAAALLAAERLPPSPGGDRRGVRVKLLEAYRTALLDGKLAADARLDAHGRAETLDRLEEIAAATLVQPAAGTPDWQLLDVAERLGLLEVVDAKGRYRWVHQVVHAYLASRRVARDPGLRDAAIAADPTSPLVQLTLVLANAALRDQEYAEATCSAMRSATADLPPDKRLLVVAAVAEIAEAAGYEKLDAELADDCATLRPLAGRLARIAAVRQLATLDKPSWLVALWDYAAHDDDYGVRWQAAAGLTSHGSAAYRALAARFRKTLDDADELAKQGGDRETDDWDGRTAPLKHLAWVLPALRTAAGVGGDDDARRAAEDDLQRLFDLEGRLGRTKPITPQRGLEASLAQGLKVDALRFPDEPVDNDALLFLERAPFWYSRLNALHAVAVRGWAGRERPSDVAVDALRSAAGHDRRRNGARREASPFVRAAARLALETRDPVDARGNACIWDDEGVVVGRRPAHLDQRAAQLVGDMTVLLNMNERGTFEQRIDFGQRDEPPPCFAERRDRAQLMEGPCTCGRDLCPYRAPERPQNASREISRAFARHQRATATHRTAKLWHAHVRTGALRDFWARMEARAPF